MALDSRASRRQERYRSLFRHYVYRDLIEDMRASVNKGLVLGSDRLKDEVEQLTGRSDRAGKMGRPVLRVKA